MKKKIVILSILICCLDQIVKFLVNQYLQSVTIIDNFFYLTKVFNKGAAFSIFTNHLIFLIIISTLILFITLSQIKNFKNNKRNIIAFSFLIGGLLGNLIDRLFRGFIIDYFSFKIFGYHFPVFNIADIGIILGISLLIIAILKKEDLYGNNSR